MKNTNTELNLNNPNEEEENGPVECLGKMFENDHARREYYTELLAEKLKDPEFRKIEGFPIGEDEDILNLSDPPYYTACPNPWIADFIAEWEAQKPEKLEDYHYHREPFAADVSEGKSGLIYSAHSYHTKVPYKAIMRYILHYTEPGDIVLDSFAGTGMTGVAAQMCDDEDVIKSLDYRVKSDGEILQKVNNNDDDNTWKSFSKLGVRYSVLNDLSPIASFIAYNYNMPVDSFDFENEAKRILRKVQSECGWMYETIHSDGITKGKVNYSVWSDVFICPECSNEVVFWKEAVDKNSGKVNKEFPCPHCQSILTKRKMDRAWITKYDSVLQVSVKQAKTVQVLINYSISGTKDRYEKEPDEFDMALDSKIDANEISFWFPTERMMKGKETRRNDASGITHIHHFYTKRALYTLAFAYKVLESTPSDLKRYILFTIEQAVLGFAKISRYVPTHFSQVNQYLSGTLYIGSQVVDISLPYILDGKIKRLTSMLRTQKIGSNFFTLQTGDASNTLILDNSIDYVFIDPPFGANLNYSELNFFWESWFKVLTNNQQEAIENSVQSKGLHEYRLLMTACFKEAYRVLKPGHWMTVEFSNTKASVWNGIQTSLSEAGFIVANVSALDKKQGSFKAVTTPTAVKQDLVISAYKPNGGFEERFISESDEEGVWDFIRTHLGYLSKIKQQGSELTKITERDPRILYDKVVSYFVRNLRDVPLSSKEFQEGLLERFAERDGMIFLPEQVAEYDKARMSSSQLQQMTIFVDDEASSIEWLRQLLNSKPQTYQDIHPKFIHELSGWKKAEMELELSTLLEENYLKFDGESRVPPQIHSYLSTNFKELRNLAKDDPKLLKKAKDRWYVPNPEREEDLQKLRERSLLKQFDEYKNHTDKKLRTIRLEAVRCGFKKAWEDRDYTTIITVAEKIPDKLLQEDPKLLFWYDNAQTRNSDSSIF